MTVKILLVDDDETALLIHKKMLSQCGEVVAVTAPEEALALLQEQTDFAVIVSDQYMPAMSGAAFLQASRESVPHSVRIMITAHADLTVAMEAVNRGQVFRFLTKPCRKAELVQAVEDGLRELKPPVVRQRELAEPLTEREQEVLQHVGDGLSNAEIAALTGVGVGTIKTHLNHIFGKLDVNNRTKAAAKAKELGLLR